MAYEVTGKEKLKQIEHFISYTGQKQRDKKVVDIGGTLYTYKFFKKILPQAKIITLNNHKPHLEGCENGIEVNAEKDMFPREAKNADIVVAADIMEHLVTPDNLIKNAKECLKTGGHLIITTPNLACLYNRLFLLLGWSLTNYHPSNYRTGNPLIKIKESVPLWSQYPHKSVFTPRGLKELLENFYGFQVIQKKGFTYAVIDKSISDNTYSGLRRFINKIIPNSLKEGIFIAARKR